MPVKNLPKDQTEAPRVRITFLSGREYLVSSDKSRENYTLWEVTSQGYNKIDEAENPFPLYQKAESDNKEKKGKDK